MINELSIFIDESGDFGEYSIHSPYYFIGFVFHNQNESIKNAISSLDNKLSTLGFINHAIHTAPIIRHEKPYNNTTIDTRRKLLSIFMSFIRNIKIKWTTISIEKRHFYNIDQETSRLAKMLSQFIKDELQELIKYDIIKIYYDNGQTEVKTLINSVFSANLPNVEMRNILSTDYRLFQVADFICTFDLLYTKYINKTLSKSELIFFGSERILYRNYIKPLMKLKY